jgi:anti-sigma factor RsiW
MSCRQISALLDAFLDGELQPEQVLSVEEHTVECEECRERARFGTALRASMRHALHADAAPSAGFEARLTSALRAERERALEAEPPPRRRFRLSAAIPFALAAATTFSFVTWVNTRINVGGSLAAQHAADPARPQVATAGMVDPEQLLEELVSYHAAPPAPEVTEPSLVPRLEPEMGMPVHLPLMKQYGASWEGGSVIPVRNNHRAAIFRYRLSNHPVTVYIYDARAVRLRGVLEPRVVHNRPVHVGERHGYSIAALEQHQVGCAVATDLDDDESAELVSTIY